MRKWAAFFSDPRALLGALALVAASVALPAFSAHAEDYQLCNETSYVLDAAIARPFGESEEIEVAGWHRLFPGYCESVLPGPLAEGTYYVYARSIAAHQGRPQIFGGEELLCTRPLEQNFVLREHVFCRMNQPGQRGEKVGFAVIEPGQSGWITHFSPRQSFSSRRHAIVAGVQRLLEDNDYEIGTIDGFAGKITLQAVKSFQRRHGLRPTGVISKSLFAELIGQAAQRGEKTGLHICNDSDHYVWSAVGYRSRGPDPEFESNGWIRIPPHACRPAIYQPLEQASYYIYAQAVNEAGAQAEDSAGQTLIWEGDFAMCIAQTEFRIRGAGQCAARGYREAYFKRIRHYGSPGFTETLAPLEKQEP